MFRNPVYLATQIFCAGDIVIVGRSGYFRNYRSVCIDSKTLKLRSPPVEMGDDRSVRFPCFLEHLGAFVILHVVKPLYFCFMSVLKHLL